MFSPQPSAHRLGPGLPGYLIPFAPLAFAPQRQKRPSVPLSPPVFLPISTHFTAPPEVPHAPTSLETSSIQGPGTVEPYAFTPDFLATYAPFKPSESEQRSHGSSYRGCWHELSPCFLQGSVRPCGFPPPRQCFTTRRPSSHTRRRSVRLAPIAEDPRLQPPVGVWPVSQCQWRRSCSHTC